jgi:hypothetical protein
MSLNEIEKNMDGLEDKPKEDLIRYVHELMVYKKRQDSKIVGLKTEIRFLNRHMEKIRDLINRTLNTKVKEDVVWESHKK